MRTKCHSARESILIDNKGKMSKDCYEFKQHSPSVIIKSVDVKEGCMQEHIFIEPEKMDCFPVVIIEENTPQDQENDKDTSVTPKLPHDVNAFRIISKQYYDLYDRIMESSHKQFFQEH